MLKVLELFAGIGACSKALTNLGIEHEIVDAVEIDKYAIKSFNAIHGTNFEPQDITKWDKDIEVDLIMHGSPCQDFSVAGKQAGGDEGSGTRSSLMYETLRIVEKLKPKYVIWENVKNLLSKKHRHNFDAYLEAMEKLGYKNYYQVLNAKDFGIPQNRERVFTVSILDGDKYLFPEPAPLEKKLKDVLEKEVDEKYYLSEKAMSCFMSDGTGKYPRRERFLQNINRKNQDIGNSVTTRAGSRATDNFVKEPFIVASRGRYSEDTAILRKVRTDYGKAIRKQYEAGEIKAKRSAIQKLEPRTDGMTNTITTVQKDNYVAIRTANKTGYDLAKDGDGVDLAYPKSTTRRGRVGHGVSKTLPTSDSQGVLDGACIRKLTPKECWRLMGFDDASFERAEKVNSNTQLYKQAGNSIVVNVLEAILKELL